MPSQPIHHFDPFVPMFPSDVGSTNVVVFNKRQLPFDGIWVPLSQFVQ